MEVEVYIQAGKTGLWNIEVTGPEKIQDVLGGKVAINAEDMKTAQGFCEKQMQVEEGNKKYRELKMEPANWGEITF